MSIFPSFFFTNLCVKNWRYGGESLLKNGTIDGLLTKHVIPEPDLRWAGPRHFKDLCNIFLPNISEDPEKSYYLSEGGPSTVPFGKYGAGYCITFIKSLDEAWGSNF